ncbi:MAG: LysR family transcriptional regulator [Rubrivivax sp.]|nr:LysR family transcriptional regulator [Rubrivivax sp.]
MTLASLDPAALALVAAVDECGSLSAAARALGITQPAMTKQLARLEVQLGLALFTRGARGVLPTAYAQALLPRARIVRAQLAMAAQELDQLRGAREGRVTVALSHLAVVVLLPRVLPAFRAAWPNIVLRFVPTTFPHRYAGLREGDPDMALAQLPGDALTAEYSVRPLLQADVAVVARPGHPLARAVSLAELRGAEWVLPSLDSATTAALAAALQRARLPPPHCIVTSETLTGLETIVAASDLLGAMPAEVAAARVRAGSGLVRLPLAPAPRGHALALVRWADAPPTPAAQALAEMFVQAAREVAHGAPARRAVGAAGRR